MSVDVADARIALDFVLPADREAHEPPEARGVPRDGVAMLVSRGAAGEISHHAFTGLPALLLPGDLLVVNTSATVPAAVALPCGLAVGFATPLAGGGSPPGPARQAARRAVPAAREVFRAPARAGPAVPARVALPAAPGRADQ